MVKKHSRRRPERLVAFLLSLLFMSTAVWAAAKYMVHAPEPDVEPYTPEEVTNGEETGEADPAPKGRQRRKYCYNILLSGLDDHNGGSDTNILMRFDAVNKSIDLVSLPRDTLLNHTWASNKLNYAYAKGGTALLREEISDLLGVPVDFEVTVDLKGFVAVIDQIGGVDFDIPVNMDYDDPYQDLHIHFNKGMRHLNGQEAMEVVRWRKNNDGTGYAAADIGRISTQQAFLREAAKQLLSLSNIREVPAIVNILYKHVKTDLELGELVWLATEALNIGLGNLNFYTLPGDGQGYYRHESVYVLDPAATLELVNLALNPYTDEIAAEELNILVP